MSSKDESAYDAGYYTTVQWLSEGAAPQRQPKPPLQLNPNQRLDWWKGFQDAIDNNVTSERDSDILTDWFMVAIMTLFLVFGAYLAICGTHLITRLVGLAMLCFSARLLWNQK